MNDETQAMINNVVNIGYGNMVMASKVVAVLSPDSAPMRRLKEEAKERKMLIDATQGRKTRAIIITDSDHIILSAVQVETLMQRFLERGDQ
jgi:extracellular matrix regulatory protein A